MRSRSASIASVHLRNFGEHQCATPFDSRGGAEARRREKGKEGSHEDTKPRRRSSRGEADFKLKRPFESYWKACGAKRSLRAFVASCEKSPSTLLRTPLIPSLSRDAPPREKMAITTPPGNRGSRRPSRATSSARRAARRCGGPAPACRAWVCHPPPARRALYRRFRWSGPRSCRR